MSLQKYRDGVVFLDYNGVMYDGGKVCASIISLLIQALSMGFTIALITNNRCDEVIDSLTLSDGFFLAKVSQTLRGNFCIYPDNRTTCYICKNDQMVMDESFSAGKGFESNQDKHDIAAKIQQLLSSPDFQEKAKMFHPNGIFPDYIVKVLELQIRVEMAMPTEYDFGRFLEIEVTDYLESFSHSIEAHIGRSGFYVTRSGLDKLAAVDDALLRFGKNRKDSIYIGDKFNQKDDSDLIPVTKGGIGGFNVSDIVFPVAGLANIGKGIIGTIEILANIVKTTLPAHLQQKAIIDNYELMFERIINVLDLKKARTIGINGSTNAGKTTISSKMADYFSKIGMDVVVLRFDYFLKPREERRPIMNNPKMKHSIEGYYSLAWDVGRYCETLGKLSFEVSRCVGEKEFILDDIYDRQTGYANGKACFVLTPNTIIIAEGTEAINKHSHGFFDLRIKIRSNPGVILDRIISRELEKDEFNRVPTAELMSRYENLEKHYIEYLSTIDEYYDFLIDTSSFEYPLIVDLGVHQGG